MKQLVIESLPQAYEVIKGMDLTLGWEGDCRESARQALKVILEERMNLACFVLGHSTRKVAQALLPVLGEPVSHQRSAGWPGVLMLRGRSSIAAGSKERMNGYYNQVIHYIEGFLEQGEKWVISAQTLKIPHPGGC